MKKIRRFFLDLALVLAAFFFASCNISGLFGDDAALPKSEPVADGWTPSGAETKPAPSQTVAESEILVENKEISELSGALSCVAEKGLFSALQESDTLTVTFSLSEDAEAPASDDSSIWLTACLDENWLVGKVEMGNFSGKTSYTYQIKGSEQIEALKQNGFFLAGANFPTPLYLTIVKEAAFEEKETDTVFYADFVRGFDASTVHAIEAASMKYLDRSGAEADIFSQLKSAGVNTVRLRVWNDPSKEDGAHGKNSVDVTKALAKRAVSAGMKYAIDFHFSDTWADPVSQKCPSDWASVSTVDDMKAKIEAFVNDSLTAIKNEAGQWPIMVQLGNECESGILTSGTASGDVKGDVSGHAQNFRDYINCAAAKVRALDSGIKIIMHMSRGGNSTVLTNFINNISGIDYDYIGLSYYPFFKSHGTLEGLKSNIQTINNTTISGEKKARAIIMETSFAWTCDWVGGKCDSTANQLWYYSGEDGLVCAANSLKDSGGSLVLGLSTDVVDGKTVIEPTVQNHYNAVAAVMDAAASAGALGVFYWGGDWITDSAGSVPSAMENQTFWDYDHKALPSIKVFSYGSKNASGTGGTGVSGGTGGTSDEGGDEGLPNGKQFSLTAGWDSYTQIASPSAMQAAKDAKSITITVSGTSNKVSVYCGDNSNSWVLDLTSSDFKGTISDASTISKILSGGLWICTGTAESVTVTVTWSSEEVLPDLPTKVTFYRWIADSNEEKQNMTQSGTSGVWTYTYQKSGSDESDAKFKIIAGENDWYGDSSSSGTLEKNSQTDCKTGNAAGNYLITVDFSQNPPTWKAEIQTSDTSGDESTEEGGGGVTDPSPGTESVLPVSVKLNGEFGESWVDCTESLTGNNGVWSGTITSVKSNGWDNFQVVAKFEENGSDVWYGCAEGLSGSITDAELVKNAGQGKNFWLATAKGGKSTVTVNFNTMKITVAASN